MLAATLLGWSYHRRPRWCSTRIAPRSRCLRDEELCCVGQSFEEGKKHAMRAYVVMVFDERKHGIATTIGHP